MLQDINYPEDKKNASFTAIQLYKQHIEQKTQEHPAYTFINNMYTNSPDEFYAKHHQKLNFIKKFLFENVIRKQMNNNVERIRDGR